MSLLLIGRDLAYEQNESPGFDPQGLSVNSRTLCPKFHKKNTKTKFNDGNALLLINPSQRRNVARPILDNRHQVFSPTRKCGRLLGIVFGAIVDAGDTPLGAAHMVQDGLDDMGLNPDVVHARGNSSPDVVDNPRRNIKAGIEAKLGFIPAAEAALPRAKY